MVEARAVVFDLDDTLYPYRRFVVSGFAALAGQIERDHGLPARRVLRALCRARVTHRGREVQRLCDLFGLPSERVPALVDAIREHSPSLRLPARSVRVLHALRPGWRLGILTNGVPAIQRRKVAALGLAPLVDAVVCAGECGRREGKPAREAFAAVLERLGTAPGRTIFVGDDPVADIEGAARAGLKTIHLLRPGRTPADAAACSATVTDLEDVPAAAVRLLDGGVHRTCHSNSPVGRSALTIRCLSLPSWG